MKARVLSNKKVGQEYFRVRFHSPGLAGKIKPGQFGMVKVIEGNDPFLRRPMSFCSVDRDKGHVDMLYRVVGKGTKYLATLKPQEETDILGPLGNGFNIRKNRKVLIIGGGIGISPLVGLCNALSEKQTIQGAITVLIGGRTKDDILAVNDFKKRKAKVGITTEDGSLGRKGLVTDFMLEFISSLDVPSKCVVYTCGPRGMLKEINKLAESFSMECQVSLEAHMACGTGACLGCVTEIRVPETESVEYFTVCKQGPVFDGRVVSW